MKTLGNASRIYPPRTIGAGPSMNVAYTDLANIFTQAQEISRATAGTIAAFSTSENSATVQVIDCYRHRAGGPGQAGDDLTEVQFNGNDAANNKTLYARTFAEIADPTNGSEDGRYYIGTARAGTTNDWIYESGTLRFQGLTLPSAAGGFSAVDVLVSNVSIAHGVAQRVTSSRADYVTCGTIMPVDDTIPQITEGTEVLTVAITPRAATSTLRIEVNVSVGGGAGFEYGVALFVDATANALSARSGTTVGLTATGLAFVTEVSAASVAARTYRVRVGSNAASDVFLNGDATSRLFGGVNFSYITVTEYFA